MTTVNNRKRAHAGALLTIPHDLRPESYLAPAGAHLATLSRVIFIDRENGTARRLVFRIAAPNSAPVHFVVAKTYEPDDEHDLVQALVGWLGPDLHRACNEDGQLDLTRLEGIAARISVRLVRRGDYDESFRVLESIQPAGPDRLEPVAAARTEREEQP